MTIQPNKKNEQDKKLEDQSQTTRAAFDKENQAQANKPGAETSVSVAYVPAVTQPKKTELEAQVQESKSALANDVKALSEKVNPDHLKEEAKNALVDVKDKAVETVLEAKDKAVDTLTEAKDATVETLVETKDVVVEKLQDYKEVAVQAASDAGDQAVRAGKATWKFASANAVPLALIGIGASWLIAGSRRSRQLPDYRTDDRRDEYDYDSRTDLPRRATEPQYGQRPSARVTRRNGGAKKADSKVANAARQVEHEASDIGHQAKDLAVHTGERAVEAYDRAGSVVRSQALRSREFAWRHYTRVRDGSRELIRENPLAVGALTLATGIGVGMLLPSTRTEDELYGETRDRLIDDARDVAAGMREAAQNVSDVAKDTARSIT